MSRPPIVSSGEFRLTGRTVLVLGGTSGIGEEIARQAGRLGAEVAVTGRDPNRLTRAGKHPWVVRTAQFDAHDDEGLDDFFAGLTPVDHLVSMTGDSMAGGFLTTTPETMRHVWESKFWANWRIGQHAVEAVRVGGSLTYTSGTGGRAHEVSASDVANRGISALVEGLAYELAPHRRVNAVAPTFMGTNTSFWNAAPDDELRAQHDAFARTVPLRRLATVSEVASTYVHLMTNTFITGQVIAVDGGVMLDT